MEAKVRLVWLVAVFGVVAWASGSPGMPPAKVDPAERVRVRDRLWAEAEKAETEGRLDHAVGRSREALAIERELFADKPEVITALEWTARRHELQGEWGDARKLRKEVVAVREKASGPKHWQAADARRAADYVDALSGLSAEKLRLARAADRAHADGLALVRTGKAADAIPLFRQAYDTRREVLGEAHFWTLFSRTSLGASLLWAGDAAAGLEHLGPTTRSCRETFGDAHPTTAFAAEVAADAHAARSDHRAAVKLYKQVLDVRRNVYGFNDTGEAPVLAKLAQSATLTKEFREAAAARTRLVPSPPSSGPLPVEYWAAFDAAVAAHRDACRAVDRPARRSIVDLDKFFYERHVDLARQRRDYSAAVRVQTAWAEALDDALGPDHWRTADARRDRDRLGRLDTVSRDDQNAIEQADRNEPTDGSANGLAQVRTRVFGTDHPDFARSLSVFGMAARSRGDLATAERHLARAYEVRRKALGDVHPQTAISLNDLGLLAFDRGDDARALTALRAAARVLGAAVDHRHPAYRATLNNLAVACQRVGDHVQARQLLREAYDLFMQATGPEETRYTEQYSLSGLTAALTGDTNWSGNLELQGRYAMPFTGDRPEQARLLNNLARADMAARDFPAALQRLVQAADIHVALASDTKNPHLYVPKDHAACLNNLGLVRVFRKEHDQARPPLERSLELRKQLGEDRPEYATGLTSLALLQAAEGRPDDARPLLARAAEVLRVAAGERAPAYADVLGNLALVDATRGDQAAALRTLSEVVRLAAGQLAGSAAAQSEREQLAHLRALRGHLDAFLAVALKAGHDPAATYAPVLAWKGSVFARQRRLRERRVLAGPGRGEAARLLGRLEDVARQIGREARQQADYPTPDRLKAIAALERQKEDLEQRLAAASPEVRDRRAAEAVTSQELAAALPGDAALVDYLEYVPPALDPAADRPRRLAAFVVRRGTPVVALDLGLAKPVAEAVDAWRGTTDRRHPATDESDPAAVLRTRVWDPVAAHLGGVKLVLVSPDGPLGRLPFAALPGKDRDAYLVEEVALAAAPVPQELPRLLARAAGERADGDPTVLVVGDVDFGDPGPAAGRDRAGGRWAGLPGTRGEMLAVRDSFDRRHPFPDGQVRVLRGKKATEALFREQAPRHRWLHLATHGYFARPEAGDGPAAQSGAAGVDRGGFHPGVLSGLVLAGANRPPRLGEDDGVLTALEVAELDLGGVDAAVLSACETGLGEAAGGEGVLGLQRAFQTAGVRTVAASLWPVDDAATRRLMERFYEHLWQTGLPPVEALRKAQLDTLRGESDRGMVLKDAAPGRPARVPPRYWAAFVLSGGW